MKIIMPDTCSLVQTLLKRKNDKNKVVALRAVDVIDIVSAPKFFVMAAEQLEPKNPIALKIEIQIIFPGTDQVRSLMGRFNSSYVPG